MGVVKQSDATVTVVNFWATWCVPCVEEFPAFVKLEENLDERGVDVMFISTDFPNQKQKVVDFLKEHGVSGTSYLKTGKTTPFVNGFSEEWSGAVPATFIYDSDGTLLDFRERCRTTNFGVV
jgi:thiol-disulfide isomerase/thioredoxin